jgi:hypothetical protein
MRERANSITQQTFKWEAAIRQTEISEQHRRVRRNFNPHIAINHRNDVLQGPIDCLSRSLM